MKLLNAMTTLLGLVRIRNRVSEKMENLEARAEILRLEWLMERRRWARLAIWSFLAAVAVFMTLLVLTLLVLACWWDTPNRVVAVLAVALFWASLSLLAVGLTVRTWQKGDQAFVVSRTQLKSDWRGLRRFLGGQSTE
jgi:uncharacterized membrane protein YqjE